LIFLISSVDVWKILLGVDPDALRMKELLRTNRLASELFRDESSDRDPLTEPEDTYPPKAFSASPPGRASKSQQTKGKNPFGDPSDVTLEYFRPQRPNPFVSERVSPHEDGSSVRSFPISGTQYDGVPSPFYPPEEEPYWEDDMGEHEAQIDIPAGKTRHQSSCSTDGERSKRRSTLLSDPNLAIPSLGEVVLKLGQTTYPVQSEESPIYCTERHSVHLPAAESDNDSSYSFFSSPRLHKPLERLETSDIPKKENSFVVSRQHQRSLIAEDKYRCRFNEISRSNENQPILK